MSKKKTEIKVTQVVTFPEARHVAEGIIGAPSYAKYKQCRRTEFEDRYNNTVHSEMYSGEELLELPATTTQPEEERTVPDTTKIRVFQQQQIQLQQLNRPRRTT